MAVLTEEITPSSSPSPSLASSSATAEEKNNAKIQEAAERKQKGNEAFKKGEFQAALKEYHTALLLLVGLSRDAPGIPNPSQDKDAGKELIDREISVLYSNQAAVHLKTKGKESRALACCNDALKRDPSNKKAAFRKAVALNALGEVVKAQAAVKDLDPEDSAVKGLLKQMATEEAARSAKADGVFRGMFKK